MHNSTADCINYLYVAAFTSDIKYADANEAHHIILVLMNGEHSLQRLLNLPGDDLLKI